jgi:ABC-type transport system involved in Fe-S cluster assembly fused permease/ATPase subunit
LKLFLVFEISMQCCKMFVFINKISFVAVKLHMHMSYIIFLVIVSASDFLMSDLSSENPIVRQSGSPTD